MKNDNRTLYQIITEPFSALNNRVFAKLYVAQTVSLVGDAFTWVGLALLASQLNKEHSSEILATALTLRVTDFIIFSPYSVLLVFWVLAGLGQSLAEMPSETLIAETIDSPDQGKVYGAHFAFSPLWWAIAYPVAGFISTRFPQREFLFGGRKPWL